MRKKAIKKPPEGGFLTVFHKKMTDESFNAYDFTSIDAFLTKVDNLIINQEPQGKESYHENWNC